MDSGLSAQQPDIADLCAGCQPRANALQVKVVGVGSVSHATSTCRTEMWRAQFVCIRISLSAPTRTWWSRAEPR
ncbi:Uncharacterised protein [Mycobacterium tuberculosis]|uniref:Uncharacterized protein n=1 Tax=Mycobacterium tuberculosis TaxID=1773 RepID=A0A654ZZB2_MYCTX|nr:Uncharacterised protein [Mycobacterium tuberculosis]CKR56209.1 Uncharacterised protein [Mycobacterium tuberculosis]